MAVYVFIITLCVLSASHVHAGLICPVEIDTPKWYQPEYESVTVDIEFLTTTKTIDDGQESFSPEDHVNILITSYGTQPTPPEVGAPSSTSFTDSNGELHVVNSLFNGTHVCLGYDQSTREGIGGSGSRSRTWCSHTCVAAFNTSYQQLLYHEGNGTNTTLFDYLVVKTKYANAKTAIRCYIREEPYRDDKNPLFKFPGTQDYCPLGEKCTVTVAKKDASSPVEYYARCQPNNTDICANQGCKKNTLAPYVGDGMYSSVCDWCCGFYNCNNIKNCTQDICSFYGEPIEDDDKDTTGGVRRLSLDVSAWLMVVLATFRLYLNC